MWQALHCLLNAGRKSKKTVDEYLLIELVNQGLDSLGKSEVQRLTVPSFRSPDLYMEHPSSSDSGFLSPTTTGIPTSPATQVHVCGIFLGLN